MTVFRARIKPAAPRRFTWDLDGIVGIDLNVTANAKYPDGSQSYTTISEDPGLAGWFLHESDLDLFESWVEFPKGAELIASTYTAERLLPNIT